jgi:hypothetical protein
MIQAAGFEELQDGNSDLGTLLDWVYYHDVLARFSIRHWHKGSLAQMPLSPTSVSNSLAPSSTIRKSPRAKVRFLPKVDEVIGKLFLMI